jgi:hypothetical protein
MCYAAGAVEAFEAAIDSAVRGVVRIVFSDLLPALIDFDAHWLETREEVCGGDGGGGGAPSGAMMLSSMSKKMKTSMTSVMGMKAGGRERDTAAERRYSTNSHGANGHASLGLGLGLSAPSPSPLKAGHAPPLPVVDPMDTITMTLADYFRDLRHILEEELFLRALAACCQVCVIRYMLFLKRAADQMGSPTPRGGGGGGGGAGSIVPERFLEAVEADALTLATFFAASVTGEEAATPAAATAAAAAAVAAAEAGAGQGAGAGAGVLAAMAEAAVPGDIRAKLDCFRQLITVARAGSASEPRCVMRIRYHRY